MASLNELSAGFNRTSPNSDRTGSRLRDRRAIGNELWLRPWDRRPVSDQLWLRPRDRRPVGNQLWLRPRDRRPVSDQLWLRPRDRRPVSDQLWRAHSYRQSQLAQLLGPRNRVAIGKCRTR